MNLSCRGVQEGLRVQGPRRVSDCRGAQKGLGVQRAAEGSQGAKGAEGSRRVSGCRGVHGYKRVADGYKRVLDCRGVHKGVEVQRGASHRGRSRVQRGVQGGCSMQVGSGVHEYREVQRERTVYSVLLLCIRGRSMELWLKRLHLPLSEQHKRTKHRDVVKALALAFEQAACPQ